jgi:tyrosyl-tRNA synthetase
MVLDRDRTEVRHNSEWLAPLMMEDIIRLTRATTVARVLERDDFSKRYAAGDQITLTELLYPLMQAYDSVAVDADVELGGTDQLFNLLLARDVQQAYGVAPQVALTMPILPGTDGVKRMSKSEGNYIGVTEPPEEIFGKTMSVPDAAMPAYYELLLDRPLDGGLAPVQAKRALARALVERFAGPEAAREAEARFDRIHVRHDVPDDVEEWPLPAAGGDVHLPALLAEAFGISRSEARRLLAQGGVKVDGEVLAGDELDVPAERLAGRVVQLGRRRFKRFVLGS